MTGTLARLFLFFFFNYYCIEGLYEDQIGKFDWRQQYVGEIKDLFWDQSFSIGKRIVVNTELNVLAAIHSQNGSLAWRKTLEEGDRGSVEVIQHQNNVLVTVCGKGKYIRSWHSGTGTLFWEVVTTNFSNISQGSDVKIVGKDDIIALASSGVYKLGLHNGKERWRVQLPSSDNTVFRKLILQDGDVYAVGWSTGVHVMVIVADSEGTIKQQKTIPAAWIRQDSNCIALDEGFLLCYDDESTNLQLLNVVSGQVFVPVEIPGLGLPAVSEEIKLQKLRSSEDSDTADVLIKINRQHAAVVKVSKDGIELLKDLPKVSAAQITEVDGMEILLTLHRLSSNEVMLSGYDLASGGEITELSQKINFNRNHGNPIQLDAVLVRKKDGRLGYKVAIRAEDYSLQLIQKSGRVSWKREEALAYVLAVEMMDLPVSENQAKFEDEFGSEKEDIISMFIKRFTTQFSQLTTFIEQQVHKLQGHRHHGIPEVDDDNGDEEEEELTRDEFNLNKMIVTVTSAGKIYGIRSTTGHIEWDIFLPDLSSFKRFDHESMMLYVQRTTAHFPNPPQCAVLGRNENTGYGLLFAFNPITGKPLSSMPPGGLYLNYNILQAYMIGEMDSHFLRGIIILDDQYQLHTFPDSFLSIAKKLAPSMFMFVANVDTGIISGYRSKVVNQNLVAETVWTVNLQKKQQTITNVVCKRSIDHVHSQGRVLGDRSVLYKYINPNLIVVTTEGEEGGTSVSQKGPSNFVNIYLIDSVTGHIVFHANHKRTRGPVNVVHAENWVVYDYINVRSRRHEIAVLELFEGKEQSNSSAFSSFTAPREPLVLRQSYILPVHITTMAVTVTEKGITSRSLIFAMTAGKLLQLPKALLDPRRPIIPTQETMEEGTIPYIPEIPISTEAMFNYNLSVDGVRGIHTSPAGLESTSLVFSYGLDLFFTRVTPSKMFDVLKEDFDFYFISLVLVGMFLVTFITQKLAARKALSRAWK